MTKQNSNNEGSHKPVAQDQCIRSIPPDDSEPNLSIYYRKEICLRWEKLVDETGLKDTLHVPPEYSRVEYMGKNGESKFIEIQSVRLQFRYLGFTDLHKTPTIDINDPPVILIDVDHSWEEDGPSEFIEAVAKIIIQYVKKPVRIERIGGDSFTHTLHTCADAASAWSTADFMMKKSGY